MKDSMIKPAYCRPLAFAAFCDAIEDCNSLGGLTSAATAIARHELPHSDPAAVESTLDQLAAAVRRAAPSGSVAARLAHLHDLLFDVVGFRGNTDDFYNTANSYLPEVLRTRRGIPITLVLVYKAVAERVGLSVDGINSPGHFLAAVHDHEHPGDTPLLVDPFYGGGVLDREEAVVRLSLASGRPVEIAEHVFRPASHAQWLLRILNNLVATFAHSGRERDALAMRELQVALVTRERYMRELKTGANEGMED
jgi:regulator of sirC expression with transglutaminase-like and TPR domain